MNSQETNTKISTLVICDSEEEYAMKLGEYLREIKDSPWVIRVYTNGEDLISHESDSEVTILLVSEGVVWGNQAIRSIRSARTVVLKEDGAKKQESIVYLDKYQAADELYRKLLELYAELSGWRGVAPPGDRLSSFVGFYSPVHRTGQSTFSITMGQLLASRYRVLYLNFEQYAGLERLTAGIEERDLADLLYFLSADNERFRLKFQSMVKQIGNMDFIPTMKAGRNILGITGREWVRLLNRIETLGLYDYVILDLTESMQGLFDVLRSCKQVYTVCRTDRISESKVMQYEHILQLYQYEDVAMHTCKCRLPNSERLPGELEMYSKSEIADYVKGKIRELEAL